MKTMIFFLYTGTRQNFPSPSQIRNLKIIKIIFFLPKLNLKPVILSLWLGFGLIYLVTLCCKLFIINNISLFIV
jgi:hypothetical protein